MALGIFHYRFSEHLNRYFPTEYLKGCVHPNPGDSPEALLVSVPEPLEDLVAGEQETAAVRLPGVLPVPHHQGVTLTIQTEPRTI